MKRMLSTLFGTLAIAATALTAGIEVGNPHGSSQLADSTTAGNPTKPKPTFAGSTEAGGSSSGGGTQAPKRTLA